VIPHTPLFIGGERRPALSGERFETRNPADGSVLATIDVAGEADVDAAVEAARAGFRSGRR